MQRLYKHENILPWQLAQQGSGLPFSGTDNTHQWALTLNCTRLSPELSAPGFRVALRREARL